MRADNVCYNCMNYDKDHMGCGGLSKCSITHTLTYAKDNCSRCPFFVANIPSDKSGWIDAQRIKPSDSSITCALAVLPVEELPFANDEYTYYPSLAYWDGENWRDLNKKIIDYPVSMWCSVNYLPQDKIIFR